MLATILTPFSYRVVRVTHASHAAPIPIVRGSTPTSQPVPSSVVQHHEELQPRGNDDLFDVVRGLVHPFYNNASPSSARDLSETTSLHSPSRAQTAAQRSGAFVDTPRRLQQPGATSAEHMKALLTNTAMKLSLADSRSLLSSIPEVQASDTRMQMIHSSTIPLGHYHMMDPNGDVFLIPAPSGSQHMRNLNAIDKDRREEVYRLDKQYKRRHDSKYMESEKQQRRLRGEARKLARPQALAIDLPSSAAGQSQAQPGASFPQTSGTKRDAYSTPDVRSREVYRGEFKQRLPN